MGTVSSVMASKSGLSIQSSQAGQVTVQRGNYELTAVEAADATLLVRLVKLPAQHRIVSLVVEMDDLDTGVTGVCDVGIEDTIQDPADTTDANLFATGLSMQAASTTRYDVAAAMALAAQDYDRYITIDITTGAATGAAGGIAATLTSRPELGSQFEN